MISNENVVKKQNISNENVEIKEILDRLFVYKNENDEMKYQPEDILTIDDVWLLLDYITNLQKENEILKENAIHNDKVVDKLRWNEMIYKSRNEKAIELLEKENERLNNIINELEKDIKNLYTYGIKNNAEQRDYLLNRLEGLKALKGDSSNE